MRISNTDRTRKAQEDEAGLTMMNQPFIQIDLHGLRQDEAIRVIDKAIKEAGPSVYQLQLIHGYHRGTSLRSMIYDWYQSDPGVLRVVSGDNQGVTLLILKELF